jgi:hypothetical protein
MPYLHTPVRSWCGAQLKHRDNFTFYLQRPIFFHSHFKPTSLNVGYKFRDILLRIWEVSGSILGNSG